jgi:hypothetical protein
MGLNPINYYNPIIAPMTKMLHPPLLVPLPFILLWARHIFLTLNVGIHKGHVLPKSGKGVRNRIWILSGEKRTNPKLLPPGMSRKVSTGQRLDTRIVLDTLKNWPWMLSGRWIWIAGSRKFPHSAGLNGGGQVNAYSSGANGISEEGGWGGHVSWGGNGSGAWEGGSRVPQGVAWGWHVDENKFWHMLSSRFIPRERSGPAT